MSDFLVVGGGIIGLEMATVYHALGSEVTVVELMDQIIPGADKDIVTPAILNWSDVRDSMVFKGRWAEVWRRPALPKDRPRWGRSGRW